MWVTRVAYGSPLLLAEMAGIRSEEHTFELQSHVNLVCRLLLEKKKNSPLLHRCFRQRKQPRHIRAKFHHPRRGADVSPGWMVPSPVPEGVARSLFFFDSAGAHRDLLSFPTRRSSD